MKSLIECKPDNKYMALLSTNLMSVNNLRRNLQSIISSNITITASSNATTSTSYYQGFQNLNLADIVYNPDLSILKLNLNRMSLFSFSPINKNLGFLPNLTQNVLIY